MATSILLWSASDALSRPGASFARLFLYWDFLWAAEIALAPLFAVDAEVYWNGGHAIGHAQDLQLVAQHAFRQHVVEHAAHELAVRRGLGKGGVIQDEAGHTLVEVHAIPTEYGHKVDGHGRKQPAPVHPRAPEHAVEAVLADCEQIVELRGIH